ncbi:MAG: AAA family ATPase [Chloroflexi bacterium]|nr:AAA family ATPase [Chloroflexota bacterium]
MASIFISYRRDDSAGHAGRLYDRLIDHFGPDQVFMDIDTIKPGQDFVDAVRQAIAGCDGLVAIIGREWLTISDATGARRLDDPEDIVSLEIATALEQGIRVIPVLVQGAPMPAATDFPETLKELAHRNAQEISDRSFNSDAQSLIEALEAPEPELPERNDFVGRRREMAELRTALDAAMAGRGQMVMLAGEPGIGKTRLAQELASRAESLGAQVMWGWCYEHVGAPPYWPFVQPIRTYAETVDVATLSSQMGLGGPAIAEIVPELRAKLPDLEQPVAAEPDQARFRLFDSMSTFLKNLAQDQLLLFIVEDLHWADSSSLLMLEFLVREITASPVLVVGTYRDVEITGSHPLSQTLGNLVRERHYRRVQLGGLTQQEVGEFVEAKSGAVLPDDALETIHRRTNGNPLFVNEVVGLIDPKQMTENRAWTDIIPEGIRDAIGSRLRRLSESCNSVLGTASVIGMEFDFTLLRALDSNLSPDAVLSALDEAMEARVIEDVPEAVGRYQFGHALIQQALYDDMTSIRKLRAHASIAEALEQVHQTNLEGHAAELARHFSEAASILGAEKLARYSLMAGQRALATYAYEDALVHFQSGLVARDIQLAGTGPATDDESAALLFGLARAQATTFERHRLGEAFNTLRRAFEYYTDQGDVVQAVAAAVFPVAPAGVLIPGMAQLIARALTLVPADSHEAGRLLSRYGGILGAAEGDYEGAQKALEQAISIARREGDEILELQILTNACDVSGRNLHWQESVENGVRAIDLLTGDENPYYEVLSRYFTALSLIHLGESPKVLPHAEALRNLAGRRVTGILGNLCFAPTIYLSCLQGDWDSAREYSNRSLEMSPLEPQILFSRALLEHETGEPAQGDFYLEQLIEAMHRSVAGQIRASGRVSFAITTIARITGALGRMDAAEAAAEVILSNQSVLPQDAMHAKAGIALVAVQKGDQAAAAVNYAVLLGMRGTLTSSVASIDRLLGLLSQTMENPDQAATHFEEALAFCGKAGYRPELAWTCCDYADTLLERNDLGDYAKAVLLLDESLIISTELGMRPLMERVLSRQKTLET